MFCPPPPLAPQAAVHPAVNEDDGEDNDLNTPAVRASIMPSCTNTAPVYYHLLTHAARSVFVTR